MFISTSVVALFLQQLLFSATNRPLSSFGEGGGWPDCPYFCGRTSMTSHPRALAALIVILGALIHSQAWGTPYVPRNDADILERLPLDQTQSGRAQLRVLRQQLRAQPNNLLLAVPLALRYIQQARAAGDPRYLGYAQATLAPWWDQAQPPVDVQILRATLRQSLHQFDASLTDLADVLRRHPQHVQARLTRAAIRQVRGDYTDARRDCLTLVPLATPLVAYTCVCSVSSLQGQARASYDLLQRIVDRDTEAQSTERQWALGVLAEIAERRGDTGAAQRHYRAALRAGQSDAYLLGAYADFLLDQRRPAEVVALLKDDTRIDGLLLRLALAEQALGAAEYATHRDQLRARFAAARARGDGLHQREEARFQLVLEHDPRQALRLAQDNWLTQREPADARILIESAIAADAPYAARPVLQWLDRRRVEDARLKKLWSAPWNEA